MEVILYTIPEAAKLLYTSNPGVYRLINKGKLGYVDFTGCRRIPKTEVDRLLNDIKYKK
ncbi:DNA binding domain%2C excisionase family [uncultured Clostridium sp.]|uniref:helix-turn-helix domain-containing protein n=1 Tax=uncultured Clostridium sp. TaxID=59620 RepID=UPI000820B7EB|nr:helix-turn-helix domain-containing protein [uncultured Clostridium sp.]SCJ97240.1 DNA binding domain%2C excisionase family [uncultured Clostridium sp.]